jgi:tetratricopeptide (TPR) repeat protein
MGIFKRFCVVALLLTVVLSTYSQSSDVSVSFLPGVAVPFGPLIDGDLVAYSMGGGGSLRGEIVPGFARFLFGRLSLDYDYLPLNNATSGMSFVAGGGSIGLSISPNPRIALKASGGGGLYVALLGNDSVRNPFVEGGGEFLVRLSPSLSVGLGGRYKHMFIPSGALYQGMSVQLGLSYDLAGSRKGTDIRLVPDLDSVFPLFYSYYDKNPLGTVALFNDESVPLDNVKISFFAKQYMDAPRVSAEFRRIAVGEKREVPLYALFNDSIFRVTEGTKAAGEVVIEYYYLGRKTEKRVPVTVDVQNRNAMTWDDDRKAAAFVTAKDPIILGFAKGIATMVRADKGAAAVSLEFRTGLGLFQALKEYGVGYAIDPSTPFVATSSSETTVDFLQFPNQTLAYRAGDCDDLSVMYCSLLESIGIPSAFITTPGHIYVAFNTGLSPENAARMFQDSSELILRDDGVWIPVEVTIVKDGFVRAWAVGAKQWRDANAAGQAGFYPVRKAWELYSPIGFAEGGLGVTLPPIEKLSAAYRSEMDRFSRSQVASRIASLQQQLKSGKDTEKTTNSLGILYAQFGLLDEARAQFNAALKKGEYVPALINLGNVEYLAGNMKKASELYSRALKSSPNDTIALVGLARATQSDGDVLKFRDTLAKLQTTNPAAAGKYFPSDTVSRASDAENRTVDLWND